MFHSKKLINKQNKKRIDKWCCICGVDEYALLDVHRIIPGELGGRYTESNSVTVCVSCHRSIHAGLIEIDRIYPSTAGPTLHYFKGDQEVWQKIWQQPTGE